MVWVSNQAGTCLNVSITAAHSPSGLTGFYPVEPVSVETWAVNHWSRKADATETAVIRFKNTSVTVNDVKGNDLLLIHRDAYIKVPNAEVSGPIRDDDVSEN